MDKKEFYDKNVSIAEKITERCRKLTVVTIIPQAIKSFTVVRKIAHAFGYSSLIKFISECASDEGSDHLCELYDQMSPDKQAYIDRLYNDKFVPITDELLEDCKAGEEMMAQTDIPMAVIQAIDESEGIHDDSPDDDNDTDNFFDRIKTEIINEFFDGIDPVEEFGDLINDDDE